MLYVVGTPIGNLEDITLRAIRTLGEVDFIIAEDPSHTGKLLKHLNISKPQVKYHQQSRPEEIRKIVARLVAGESAALVTDAGTPAIADPAGELVLAARVAGVPTIPVAGVSAVSTILSVAGMPADGYLFVGFLPKKKGRATMLEQMRDVAVPMVLFEAPTRIGKTLEELANILGESRRVVIGRELTKLHEEIIDSSLTEAAGIFAERPAKGEFVLVIDTN